MNRILSLKRIFIALLLLFLTTLIFSGQIEASGNWTFTPFSINQSDSQHVSFTMGDFNCTDSCTSDFTGTINSICLGTSQGACDITANSFNGVIDGVQADFGSALNGTYYIKVIAENGNTLVSGSSYQFPLQITPTPIPTDTPTPTVEPLPTQTPTPTPNIVYVNTTTVVNNYPTNTPTPTIKPKNNVLKSLQPVLVSPTLEVLGDSTSSAPVTTKPNAAKKLENKNINILSLLNFDNLFIPITILLLVINISLACLLFKKR